MNEIPLKGALGANVYDVKWLICHGVRTEESAIKLASEFEANVKRRKDALQTPPEKFLAAK